MNIEKKFITESYKGDNLNVTFQDKDSFVDDDKTDWIFDVREAYIRKVKVGLFAICEVVDDFKDIIKKCKKNIFLYTNFKQWLWLKNTNEYNIEVEGERKTVWICKVLEFKDFLEMIKFEGDFSKQAEQFFYSFEDIETVQIIYGRCVPSMKWLDGVNRRYLKRHKFTKNEIVAITAVAGSGKTTTLLELSEVHKKKKILYLAFNRALINEIRGKLYHKKIRNVTCCTFDGLMRDIFIKKSGINSDNMNIMDLKPQTIGSVIPWLANKPWRMKKHYCTWFAKFCKQVEYSSIHEYIKKNFGNKEKKMLSILWEKVIKKQFFTFDSIRKMVEVKHWARGYLDDNYDMVFFDEAQDCDPLMLKMLLCDTTIPKIFVGDPRQAIYEWRGAVNAFEKLPEHTFVIEFYKTFRLGNPACKELCENFDDLWMVSGAKRKTYIYEDAEPQAKYVYLFRSWKRLLTAARNIKNVWINKFDQQVAFMKKLHNKLKISKLSEEEMAGFADDLPSFLLKLSERELNDLISDIESNLVRNKDLAECMMYTVHSYKGLEHDIIRICDDVDIEDEENIYYVAATRGRKQIIFDLAPVQFDETTYEIQDQDVLDRVYGKQFGTLDQFIQKIE